MVLSISKTIHFQLYYFCISLFFIQSATATSHEAYILKLSKHPSVVAQLKQQQQLHATSQSVLGLPDPQIILGIDNIPVSNPSFDTYLPSSKIIGIRQAIPNHTRRLKNAQALAINAQSRAIEARYTLEKLTAQFNSHLITLDMIHQLRQELQSKLKLYQLIEQNLQGQLEAGKAIYGRFADIDIEQTHIQHRIHQLETDQEVLHHKLIALVNEVPNIPTPMIQPKEWEQHKTALYPIMIHEEKVRQSQAQLEAATALSRPHYSIQALYKQREEGPNFAGDDWFSLQASVSIPLWAHSNQKPKQAAAQAKHQSQVHTLAAMQRQWHAHLASLKTEQNLAYSNILLLKKKRRSLQQMTRAHERNYKSGTITLETTLHSQLNLAEINIKLIQEHNTYTQKMIEFNQHIAEAQNLQIQEH